VSVPVGPLLAEWVAAYLDALGARRAAKRTVETRAAHLRAFVAWAADRGTKHGALLSSSVLLNFQRHLHQHRDASGRPYAALTQRGMLSDLRAFGRWCVAEGLIARGDPFAVLELPKTPAALPAGLFTPEQIAALLAMPDVATPLGLRNRALLETTAAVGLIGRELTALRLPDSEADTGLVIVRPLERGRPRTVPLGTAAGRWLRRYLTEARPRLVVGRAPTDALFVSQHGRPLTVSDAAHIAREAARTAGLPTRRVLSALKDSLAVQLLEVGCDPRYLAALFGHADLQSVRKYQRMSVQQLREVHRRHHPAEREGDDDASR